MKPHVGRLLRIGIAAALTVLLLWQSDPGAVLESLRRAAAGPILVAILLVFLDRALMAYRWVALLCIVDTKNRPPLHQLMRMFFVSTFLGTFLPASVGGDAVRAYSLSRQDVNPADAVASVFMDRMLGVVSILLMALGGLIGARDLLEHPAVQAGLLVTVAVSVLTTMLVFSRRMTELVRELLAGVPIAIVRRTSASLLASVQRYASFHRTLGLVLAASVLVQTLRIVQTYYLGRSLGLTSDLQAYFVLVPLILLVMLLPVTINGIGTCQAAFVWLFARVGVGAADAFALSVLFLGLGILGNLPGAVLYGTGGLHAPPMPPARLEGAGEGSSWPLRRP